MAGPNMVAANSIPNDFATNIILYPAEQTALTNLTIAPYGSTEHSINSHAQHTKPTLVQSRKPLRNLGLLLIPTYV